MTQTPVEVPEALFEKLRAQFSAAQLVELTATIAWENYRARFNHAVGSKRQPPRKMLTTGGTKGILHKRT